MNYKLRIIKSILGFISIMIIVLAFHLTALCNQSSNNLISKNLTYNFNDSTKQLLRLKVFETSTPGKSDETVIYFDSNATTLYNPDFDSFKLMNTALDLPNLYVIGDKDTFAIKCFPNLASNNFIVPIGLKVNNAGVYELNATEVFNFTNINVSLVDSQKRITHDLKNIPVDTFSYKQGLAYGRFFIKFSPYLATNIHNSPFSILNSQFFLYVSGNVLHLDFQLPVSSFQLPALSISIYNVLGQNIINNRKINNCKNSFILPKGAFIVRLISNDSSKAYTKKIVIQ